VKGCGSEMPPSMTAGVLGGTEVGDPREVANNAEKGERSHGLPPGEGVGNPNKRGLGGKTEKKHLEGKWLVE